MADRVVIDASVAVALVREESGSPIARGLVTSWTGSGSELLVPSHFWLEVTWALTRRPDPTSAVAVEALIALDRLGLRTFELDRPLLLLVIEGVAQFRLSTYDAAYLALAQSTDSRLATLDRRLAVAAVRAGITVEPDPPTRLAEDRGAYGSEVHTRVDWAHSAVVGAHIAELRRRAIAGA